MSDFTTALSTLKSTEPTGDVRGAEKVVRQNSTALDLLAKDEDRDARDRLRQRRKAQEDEVRRSYREAHEAVRNMLRDRLHLEKAQRKAGVKEHEYEREEGRNEHFAEHQQDLAEHQQGQAFHAIEHIFEYAEDRLVDESQKQRQTATRVRLQAVQEAVETLRTQAREDTHAARTSKQGAAMSESINLLEEP